MFNPLFPALHFDTAMMCQSMIISQWVWSMGSLSRSSLKLTNSGEDII